MSLVPANLDRETHRRAYLELHSTYMRDPMGGAPPFSHEQQEHLLRLVQANACARLFLWTASDQPGEDSVFIGYLLAFETISTFVPGFSFNIHDFCIAPDFRGRGEGSAFMQAFLEWARNVGGKKVTLEVRDDNASAQTLYANAGFGNTAPPMHFLVTYL